MKTMMHICYIYISSFGVLEHVGFALDHRYKFAIEDGCLHVSVNTDAIPNGFWGAGIYSLTAIVGNNGCGKTTALRLMKRLFVDGAPRNEDTQFLIVYEDRGSLYLYNPLRMAVTFGQDIRLTEIQQRRPIETLYYSGHFQPYSGDDDMELAGSYEASDGWLLVHDLQDYANVDSLHLSEPLYNHLLAYYAQNNYRICEVLSLEGLRGLLHSVRLPRYVQFGPNRGGWNSIKLDRIGRFEGLDVPNERPTSANLKQQALERLVYYDILNLIAEGKGEPQELCDFLKMWQAAPKDDGVVMSLEYRIVYGENASEAMKALASLHYVIQKIEELCEFDDNSRTFYVDVMHEDNKLRTLINEMIRTPYFLTARFFDISYNHNLAGTSRLSSGEQELLNLLSRLYYGITIKPQKFHNIESPRLLLLDEAEIGFHPDWQRQYVKVLTEFMTYMRVKAGVDFQIVITSHSPIILSDMPKDCAIMLKRNEETGLAENVSESRQQTFGANVFELYRDSFFLDGGMVGEFAAHYIEVLNEDVDRIVNREDPPNERELESLKRRIGLIGDRVVRDYLMVKLGAKDRNGLREYYRLALEALDHEQN